MPADPATACRCSAAPLALRPREAARALSMSQRTLELLVKAGNGPPCAVVGRMRLYPIDGLRAWLAAKAQAPTAQQPQAAPNAATEGRP